MKRSFKIIFALTVFAWLLVFSSESAHAQDSSPRPLFGVDEATACEDNAAKLDNLVVMARAGSERVFVIARLGKGETSRYLIHRRLYNAKTYIHGRLKPDGLVLAEGERVNGQGRIDFYLGSTFIMSALAARGKDLCVYCCEGIADYYGWGKRDSRVRQHQLERSTPLLN